MKKQPDIDWIFFDIGGVLFDNSESDQKIKEITYDVVRQFDPSITLQHIFEVFPEASGMRGDINQNIIALLLATVDERNAAVQKIKERLVREVDYYGTSFVPPDAHDVLPVLAKDYRLGIIANQLAQARDKLIQAEVFSYFSYVGISRELKLSKPDPRIFEVALQMTGADPKRSVMIDDNIERGLLPAKEFGMKTVWLDLGQRTETPKEIDFRIKNLRDLLAIF